MYLQLPISLPKITNFHLSTIILMFDKQKIIINFFSEVNNLVYNSMLSLYDMVKQLLCMQFSNGEGNRETVLAILTQMLSGKYLSSYGGTLNIYIIFFFFHIIVKRQTHN